MSTLSPFEGADSRLYYVVETTRGVTPDNPVWKPLRSTGGMPTVNMDSIEGTELGNGREVNDIDLGNVNVTSTITCELAYGAQDDLLAGALSSSWVDGMAVAGVDITVDALTQTYTRAAGDFVADGFAVGDFVQFPSLLLGTNSDPRFVVAVTETVITVGGVKEHKPLVDETLTTNVIKADSVGTGNECQSVTIAAEFKGKCGLPDGFLITTGVETTGSTITADQNAKITAEFTQLGYDQYVATELPVGSTIAPTPQAKSFSHIDSTIAFDNEAISSITTLGYSTEDGAAAQFALGSELSAFVSRNRIRNTVTATGWMSDFDLIEQYRSRGLFRMEMILARKGQGAMAFATNETLLTEVTPERSESPLTANITGQAIGDIDNSSLIIYRIPA